jgi:hypothetical protein
MLGVQDGQLDVDAINSGQNRPVRDLTFAVTRDLPVLARHRAVPWVKKTAVRKSRVFRHEMIGLTVHPTIVPNRELLENLLDEFSVGDGCHDAAIKPI